MKSVSGKEFARILERHGWSLLRVQGSIIFMAKPETTLVYPFRFMVIKPSKQVCFNT